MRNPDDAAEAVEEEDSRSLYDPEADRLLLELGPLDDRVYAEIRAYDKTDKHGNVSPGRPRLVIRRRGTKNPEKTSPVKAMSIPQLRELVRLIKDEWQDELDALDEEKGAEGEPE
jgi:hypothetical protein